MWAESLGVRGHRSSRLTVTGEDRAGLHGHASHRQTAQTGDVWECLVLRSLLSLRSGSVLCVLWTGCFSGETALALRKCVLRPMAWVVPRRTPYQHH